jgi:hypothetical protein
MMMKERDRDRRYTHANRYTVTAQRRENNVSRGIKSDFEETRKKEEEGIRRRKQCIVEQAHGRKGSSHYQG